MVLILRSNWSSRQSCFYFFPIASLCQLLLSGDTVLFKMLTSSGAACIDGWIKILLVQVCRVLYADTKWLQVLHSISGVEEAVVQVAEVFYCVISCLLLSLIFFFFFCIICISCQSCVTPTFWWYHSTFCSVQYTLLNFTSQTVYSC